MDRAGRLQVLALCAALAAAGGLTAHCVRALEKPSQATATSRSAPRRGRPQGEKKPVPTVDLAALLTDVPEYQGQGRNLFDFGRERSVEPEPPPVDLTTTSVPPDEDPSLGSGSTVGAQRLDLKFAGFVERKQPGGDARKVAVFLSGEEILTGAEGEVIGNRYRVVQIGLESVTVAMIGSNVTEKIPLRSN